MKHYISLISILVLMSILPLWGQSGQSLVLNGTDQLMKIASHDDFNVSAEESFTVACWVKVNRWLDGQRFVAKRSMTGTPKSGYELWGGQSSSKFYANNAPNTAGNHDNSMSVWSTEFGSLDTWAHVAFVVDRVNGKMYLYHNGKQVGNSGIKDIGPWYVENDYDVTVGTGRASAMEYAYYLKGEIDNLRFWKRALSLEEINADKVDEMPASEGLVAAYDFENIDGLTVPDVSGNGHNGVLVNYPVDGPCKVASASVVQDSNFTGRGNEDEVVLKAVLDMEGTDPVQCNKLTLNMDGTTNVQDVKSIKVYSTGNINSFDARYAAVTATLLGSCKPASGEINCELTGELTSGTNYLWITYDIADNATEGNKVDANIVSITTADETYAFTEGSVEGERTILLKRKLLFAPGDAGSKNYRIPAIITAADGSLVVATDKRKNNQDDLPEDIDVVIRRSEDGGITWSEPQTIAEGTGARRGFGDAGLVHTTEENGLLCIFVGGEGIFDNSSPSNPTRTYVCKSTDNGKTWSAPRDITEQLYGTACTVTERQGWYASFCASGNGLLTKNGRIMFVAAVRENSASTLSNFVYYSDDNGETWNVSKRAKLGGDESKVVELSDGTILMSIRRQSKGPRYYTKSTDGGITWGEVSEWTEMLEPNCNGDIIRYTSVNDGYEKNRLLHSIPNDAANRRNVSVFVSYDEGQTWPVKKSICPTGSAYSSLTILPDGTIGAYVEENYDTDNMSLYFNNFSLDWLTDGADIYYAAGETEVVKSPTFSAPEGEYENSVAIELTTATDGASIYYTLDGNTPNERSILYEGLITIEETTTVKAIAVKDGLANSEIATATYTITHPGEYCIWDEDAYPRTNTDRVVQSLSVSGASQGGIAQDFTTVVAGIGAKTQSKINFDNTADVLNATIGNELFLTVADFNLYWTHYYVYVDYNQNGVFESNEVVSYTHYSEDDGTYHDSKGDVVDAGKVQRDLPSFIIPDNAKLGETRIRFKADWNSLDPCGDASLASNRGTICDFTINIHEAVMGVVSFEQTEGATLQIMNGEEEVTNGTRLPLGTVLSVNAEVTSDDYIIRAILVNGEELESNTFVLVEDATVSLDIIKGKLVNYQVEGNGILSVSDNSSNEIASGAIVYKGSVVVIKVTPDENYHVESVLINGDDKTEECVSDVGYSLVVNEHLDIIAKFAIDSYSLNYSCNEEFGKMIVQKSNGDDVISGDLIPYNEKVTFTLQPAVRCYVASVMIDGEEKMDEILTNKSFSLNITKETTVQVVYEAEKYSLTLANDTPKKGKLMVKRLSDDIELEDQSEIIYDEELLIAWLPEEGCELAELWIKEGEDDEYDLIEAGLLEELGDSKEFSYQVFANVALRAVFSGTVSITNTEIANTTVYTKDGKLIVKDGKVGCEVFVYDVLGQVVKSFIIENALETVQLGTTSSLYLVKIVDGADCIVKKVGNM